MALKHIVYLLTLLTIVELRSPQVYENVDEAPSTTIATATAVKETSTNRTVNFASITHRDRQKSRYLEQQVVDARNQARNRVAKNQKKQSSLRKRDLNNVEPLHPLSLNYGLSKIDDGKLLNEKAKTKDEQIRLLNSLLGKSPVVQLHGLQKMLTGDHTPIMEDVVDVENPLDQPNVKVEPAPPEFQEAVASTFALQSEAQRQFEEQIETHPTYGHVVLVQPPPQRPNYLFKDDNLQYAADYAFGYKVRDVQSGNDFGHEEYRDGDSVKGRYYVLLPDGRLQNVKYFADETGYHAEVTYEGVGVHPLVS